MKGVPAEDEGFQEDGKPSKGLTKGDRQCKPYGILDLGGSSTQIAIPSDCANIRRENSFVKSFPQSGMELTREAVGWSLCNKDKERLFL